MTLILGDMGSFENDDRYYRTKKPMHTPLIKILLIPFVHDILRVEKKISQSDLTWDFNFMATPMNS